MLTLGRNSLSTFALLALAALVLSGCGPHSRRIDPDVDDELGGTGIDSAEVRTIASIMARDLLDIPQIANAANPPRIAVIEIQNGTGFVIDTEIFMERIQTLLIQNCGGKVEFLARDQLDTITEERAMKREGVFSSGEQKSLLGADYFITGNFKSISKARGGDRSDYIQYTFKIIDAESSAVVWQNGHDVKKIGEQGTIYR